MAEFSATPTADISLGVGEGDPRVHLTCWDEACHVETPLDLHEAKALLAALASAIESAEANR